MEVCLEFFDLDIFSLIDLIVIFLVILLTPLTPRQQSWASSSFTDSNYCRTAGSREQMHNYMEYVGIEPTIHDIETAILTNGEPSAEGGTTGPG